MTLKEFTRKLNNVLDNVGSSVQMTKVAKEAAKEIKTRTRQGDGVSQNLGNREKLKQLKASYKKRRRKLPLSSETTPDKSNLTQKGDMLNAIEGKGSRNRAEVFIKGPKNQEKALRQSEAGRKFMNLSKKEVDKAVNIIELDIKKDIKKQGL